MTASPNTEAPARASVPAPRRASPGGTPRSRRSGPQVVPYLLLAPAVLTILVLLGYPVVSAFVLSFQKYDFRELIQHLTVWVGFDNYVNLLTDPEVWASIVRTLVLTVACVGSIVLGGLAVALLMRKVHTAVRWVLQISLLLAWAMPIIAATTVFQWIFDQNYGILNKTLVLFGFGSYQHYNWFSTGASTITIIVVLIAWEGIPFAAFTIYAGLLAVPADLYEAAAIDGATAGQTFRTVTWPGIRAIVLLTTFLEVLWDFKVFTQVWAIRQGGPDGGSTTLSVLQFVKGLSGNNHYGLAAAVSVLMIVIIVLVTAQYLRMLLRSREVEL
jgi:N,N'-diacetylchitobiose transport system permease protein